MYSAGIVMYHFPEESFLLIDLNKALICNNAEKIKRLVVSTFANKKLPSSDFKSLFQRVIKKIQMDNLAEQSIQMELEKILQMYGKTQIQVVILKALEEVSKLMEGIEGGPFNQIAPF